MSDNRRKLNELLGLEVQLGDGPVRVAQTRVFADLREMDGTLIGTEFELNHVGNGKYTDATIVTPRVMPNFDQITVTYYIRRNDGTTPSNFYNPNYLSEQFVKDVTGQLVEDNLDAKVSALRGQDFEGSVASDEALSGILVDVPLIAEIEQDTIITGVVDEC